jgi:hypothetical protein
VEVLYADTGPVDRSAVVEMALAAVVDVAT